MTEVSRNHLLFRMELKSLSASSIRFYYEGERERKQGVKGLVSFIIHRSQRRWNKELEILNNCLHHTSGKSDLS